MSVAIFGGNECMTRRYIDICKQYKCDAKIYPKMSSKIKNLGSPDLLIFFTDTLSHKVVKCVMNEVSSSNTKIARSHSSSAAALKGILNEHVV